MKMVRSKGNVFADVGFAPGEAETLAVKSDLVTLILRAIRSRKLTQKQAAEICGTDQGTLSKGLSGKLNSLTIDRLAKWAVALGWNVKISAKPNGDLQRKLRGESRVGA